MTLLEAYIITFTASFCSLVIEMVAGRILAPFVGVSIYTWTSIIGVILAGISIGAFIGGKLIDRFPTRKTLGWLLLISGIAALTIIPLTHAGCGVSVSGLAHGAHLYHHVDNIFHTGLCPRDNITGCRTAYTEKPR